MKYDIAIIEVRGYVAAVVALDIMLKTANVELLAYEPRLGGRLVTIIVKGDISSVTASLKSAVAALQSEDKVASYAVIANPHKEILKFYDKEVK